MGHPALLLRRSRGTRLLAAASALAAVGALALPVAPTAATAATPGESTGAKGPVGWDTYRQLDRLPELPRGVETRQFSSFDRTGGNNDGFDGRASCLRASAAGCVIAERSGAGEIDRVWFTRDGGDVRRTGDITIELDGRTVLSGPLQDVVDGTLGAPFVHPLVGNADQSSGGVYIAVPMPYRHSMRITTEANPLFYHVTYRTFADDQGVSTFDPSDRAQDVVDTLQAAGQQDPKAGPAGTTRQARVELAAHQSMSLAAPGGPRSIDRLQLRLPQLENAPDHFVVDDGRAFGVNGSSQFTMAVDPANTGVRLTRRTSPNVGNQVADVYVDGQKVASWKPLPQVDSDLWRDQSVELPASATAGKASITVKNVFVSSDFDFNEFHYWADSRTADGLRRTDTLDVGPDHTGDEAAHNYAIVGQTFQGAGANVYQPSAEESARVADSDALLEGVRIRITFDGQRTVDVPAGRFFGSGSGEYGVQALMMSVRTDQDALTSWWPMPYRTRATVELVNTSDVPVAGGSLRLRTSPNPSAAGALSPQGGEGYFHATANHEETRNGTDYVFLRTSGQGKVVGVTHTMKGHIASGNTREYLEGDERVYVDGAQNPSIHGTGTEDFYTSGWYFNRGPFTAALNGNTAREHGGDGCVNDCTDAYRLLLGEAIPFQTSIRFQIEHGPQSDSPADYRSVAYWYGKDRIASRRTDSVDVGNPASESRHAYAGAVGGARTLTATYEGDDGVQHPVTDDLRSTTGAVSFRMAVDRDNRGVTLRRTSDQQDGYQSATVQVDGKDAGTWLEPLANGTHRWLDDTFQLPDTLTAGRSSVAVRLTPTGGSPAWTAARYVSLSLVPAFVDRNAPGPVRGLTASGDDTNRVDLSWQPATDDGSAPHYDVYASRTSGFTPGPATRVATTDRTGFQHTDLGLQETWHYRVRAVDEAGNTGPFSAQASATTGRTVLLEAESLLPPTTADAPVQAQGDCCGVHWSNSAQLWFRPASAGTSVTVSFSVPRSGTYDLQAAQTKASDYGVNVLAVDGRQVGQAFDGYQANGVAVTGPISYGSATLDSGRHTLTLTVTGRNAAATGFLAGLDYVRLTLQG